MRSVEEPIHEWYTSNLNELIFFRSGGNTVAPVLSRNKKKGLRFYQNFPCVIIGRNNLNASR